MKSRQNQCDLQHYTIEAVTTNKTGGTDILSMPETSLSDGSQRTQRVVANPKDIICGRGLHIMNHLGNIKLHRVVDRHRDAYQAAIRQEKASIANCIVEEMKRSGSRFIARVKGGRADEWEEVDNQTAYNKVGHALRLRKDHQARNAIAASGRKRVLPRNHDSVVGSSGQTISTALHGVAARSESAPRIQMLHNPSILSSLVQHTPLPPPDRFLLQATREQFLSQPVLLSTHPSAVASAIAKRRDQLLMNSIFENVFKSTLTYLMHSSMRQQASQSLLAGQTLNEGGVQEESVGNQKFSSASDEMR